MNTDERSGSWRFLLVVAALLMGLLLVTHRLSTGTWRWDADAWDRPYGRERAAFPTPATVRILSGCGHGDLRLSPEYFAFLSSFVASLSQRLK